MSKSAPATVDFKIGNNWVSGDTTSTANVTAIKVNRLDGAVKITFSNPVYLKLTPVRKIGYQATAISQNVLIDLLNGKSGTSQTMPKQTSLQYTIAPAAQNKTTPIEQNSNNTQPTKVSLGQNYPNPFNPTTNITFQLASSTPVTLQIFDILGRLVSSPIQNRVMDAGEHHIQFNGNNLSSGVYIYRLRTQSEILDKKMLLIK